MTSLINYANDIIAKYPELKSDIDDLIALFITEIEDGGSVTHETELCWSDIEELVKEYETTLI